MKIVLILSTVCLSFIASSQAPEPAFSFLASYPNVRDLTMAADQSEAYFTFQSPNEEIAVIVVTKQVDGNWTTPEAVSFTGKGYRDIEPFLSPDGKRLYFASDRPLTDLTSPAKDYDIWYVERENASAAWSEPINPGKPLNGSSNEFYPSVTSSGNMYFTSGAGALLAKDDIYYAEWKKGRWEKPIPLDNAINSEGYEFNAYISPDESTLIYTAYNRRDGYGSGDLYISYRDKKGVWEKAVNMGAAINSKAMDYCPFFDATNQTLYFTSKRSTVAAKSFNSLEDFLKEANKQENGWSRLYKVRFVGR